VGELVFFQPKNRFADSGTACRSTRCTCNELTAGPCAFCVMPMPAYTNPNKMLAPAVPSVQMTVVVKTEDLLNLLRTEIARLLREFSEREAGPVGIRLRQIADVFEEAA
jgi:hypothetical protein